MTECQAMQYLGVGVLTDAAQDPTTMVVAAEITTAMVRYLAQRSGAMESTGDVAPHLPNAMHYTYSLNARQTLQLAVLPATGALSLPDDHIALFTLTTRFWKRGRAPIIQSGDLIVAEFLRRTQRMPEQVEVERVPHIRAQRYFVYQMFITHARHTLTRAIAGSE